MGRPAIPVKQRLCRTCQAPLNRKRRPNGDLETRHEFERRRFCDRACMAASMEGQIKIPSPKNSHRQSGKAATSQCENCGRTRRTGRLHVHHHDLNPMNNDPSNLRTLCGSCHRRCHSPNFTETGERRVNCLHCDRPSSKRGLCATHLTRFRKYGDPLVTKIRTSSGWLLVRETGASSTPSP